jgi:5-(carboxyamino)imidazole ribonucleotide synthase
MLYTASIPLGLELRFLALDKDESLIGLTGDYRHIAEYSFIEMELFAQQCDVLTFEHELVEPSILFELESRGYRLAPQASAMALGSDKSHQRTLFADLGLPVPDFELASTANEIEKAAQKITPPLVLKSTTGGYDGRGVVFISDAPSLARELEHGRLSGSWVVEPNLDLDYEIAVVVARNRFGACVHYGPVETIQRDGICISVTAPSMRDSRLLHQATEIAREIAQEIDLVGTLAVEFFVSHGKLLINEVAPRVHNSAHLTIEAARTSQFENHLRAVADLPLGDTSLLSPAAMVNLIAPVTTDLVGFNLREALSRPSVTLHDYRKTHRIGRKVGHVTVLDPSPTDALRQALESAATAFADHRNPGGGEK